MEISAALAAGLKALTEVLDTPGVDLEALVHTFADDTRRAIDSFLGLSLTLVVDGYPIILSTMPPISSAASLRVPLTALGEAEAGSELVLYAGNAGAFVDLAADFAYALGLDPETFTLDDDLDPVTVTSGIHGLAELAQINQAVGILIDHGHLPDDAHAELHRRAHGARITLPAAAADLIATTYRGQPLDGRRELD